MNHHVMPLITAALLVSMVAGPAQGKVPLCPNAGGPAVTTTPSARSGPVKGVGDWVQHAELQGEVVAGKPFDTYLVGDSLAYHWPSDMLQRRLQTARLYNLGVAGDRTENVLWRLQRTTFPTGLHADIINLIGTNNLDRPACEVVWGIATVLEEERQKAPAARIAVISLLPRGRDLASFAGKIRTVNHDLSLLAAARGYVFADAHDKLLCATHDKARCHYYQGDQLHLRLEGYEAVTHALAASLARARER